MLTVNTANIVIRKEIDSGAFFFYFNGKRVEEIQILDKHVLSAVRSVGITPKHNTASLYGDIYVDSNGKYIYIADGNKRSQWSGEIADGRLVLKEGFTPKTLDGWQKER